MTKKYSQYCIKEYNDDLLRLKNIFIKLKNSEDIYDEDITDGLEIIKRFQFCYDVAGKICEEILNTLRSEAD